MKLNSVSLLSKPRYCHFDVRVLCTEGISKTWTGLNAGTLANSVDPDQTPQNAASDQGMYCLLN